MYRLWLISVCSLLGYFLTTSEAHGQVLAPGYTHEHWSVEDGLPVNGVTDIELTEDGYVWLSTYDGLVRFDGERFKLYNKGNTEGIVSNRIRGIYQGKDDEFFLLTESIVGNANLIHYKNNVFTSYGAESGLVGDIHALNFDKKGNLWLENNKRLLKFEEGNWVHKFPDLIDFPLGQMHFSSEGNFWLNSSESKQLYYFQEDSLFKTGKNQGLLSDQIEHFIINEADEIWISTTEGISIIKKDSVQQIQLPLNMPTKRMHLITDDHTSSVRTVIPLQEHFHYVFAQQTFQLIPPSLIEESSGKLSDFTLIGKNDKEVKWISIDNKLFHKGKLILEYDGHISVAIEDGEGGVWLGLGNGLHRLRQTLFASFTEKSHQVHNVYPITQDKSGSIWTANLGGGIFRYQNGEFGRFDTEFNLELSRVYSILEDSKEHLWFGHEHGILKWDRVSAPSSVLTPLEASLKQVRAIYEDNSGKLWFGSKFGIHQLTESKEWKYFPVINEQEVPEIRLIFEDRMGRIWFGTNGSGLLYFENGEVYPFELNERLSDIIIRSMYQDKNGVFWVGMEGGGLNRIEFPEGSTERAKITIYGEKEGLFDTVIHAILEDKSGKLWMSGNRGIFWVSHDELNSFAKGEIRLIHSTFYDERDGLPGNEANGGMQSTGLIAQDGRLWFPMVGGIAVINPDEIEDSAVSIPTLIEELVLDDTTLIVMDANVELAKSQRNLQFNYTGFNYDAKPNNIRFRYKLEGYDEEWNLAGTRRQAFYTGVPAGEYTFMVQASIFGDEWGNSNSTQALSIEPYFYETGVFIFFVLLCIGLLGFLVYVQRLQTLKIRERKLTAKVDEQTSQLKEQAERLEELDKAKSRFFTNISHEFRTPLTLMIGPLEDLKKKFNGFSNKDEKGKVNLALRNSKRLLKLVNQILDISKLETGVMELQVRPINMITFLEELCLAFTGLAERKNITFDYNFTFTEAILYVDVDMMEKIFVNILSNAFKFTPVSGSITIRIQEEISQVSISIIDTGLGIQEEDLPHIFDRFYQTNESRTVHQAGTGIGLSLVKELLELHKGAINVESEEDSGSTFTVTLRKGRGHFSEAKLIEQIAEPEVHIEEGFFVEDMDPENSSEEAPNLDSEEQTTILIIDDNADIRKYLRDHLSISYRVIEANNGEQGLEKAQSELPDIIICDVMMPKMDGYTFYQELKKIPEIDFIPVVLLTAQAEQSNKLEGLGLGVDDYIVKPFDIEEVKVRAKNLIDSRKVLKDRFSSSKPELRTTDVEIESADALFLEKIRVLIEAKMGEDDFNVEQLAKDFAMSRGALHKKLKMVIGKSPSDVIWEFRLDRAHQLISQKAGTVSEIAYSVGFKSISHFSRAFKVRYKITPRSLLTNSDS